jgi:hypothetical protein
MFSAPKKKKPYPKYKNVFTIIYKPPLSGIKPNENASRKFETDMQKAKQMIQK